VDGATDMTVAVKVDNIDRNFIVNIRIYVIVCRCMHDHSLQQLLIYSDSPRYIVTISVHTNLEYNHYQHFMFVSFVQCVS